MQITRRYILHSLRSRIRCPLILLDHNPTMSHSHTALCVVTRLATHCWGTASACSWSPPPCRRPPHSSCGSAARASPAGRWAGCTQSLKQIISKGYLCYLFKAHFKMSIVSWKNYLYQETTSGKSKNQINHLKRQTHKNIKYNQFQWQTQKSMQ